MMVHPIRSGALHLVPPAQTAVEPRVAVLLNANARKVNERVIRSLSHVVPEEDLFISESFADCQKIAQTVVDRRYPVVFTGGGDGTFVGFLNEIQRQLEHRASYFAQRPPRFGVLKLGTGNGLASLLNASPLKGDGILDDVLRARAGEVPGVRVLDLLEVDQKRAPFAGLGLDGRLLNDYIWVKENLGKGALRTLLSGAGGYFTSVALKTVPHYLTSSASVDVEVFNGPQHVAYQLNPDGGVQREFAPGALVYRGPVSMCAAGTMPYYGFGFRMFPFAGRRRGMMHLRLASVTALEVLANLPSAWKGRWFKEKRIFDFHASELTVRFARPMPFQVGGDAEGERSELNLKVSPNPVELVDFNGAVN